MTRSPSDLVTAKTPLTRLFIINPPKSVIRFASWASEPLWSYDKRTALPLRLTNDKLAYSANWHKIGMHTIVLPVHRLHFQCTNIAKDNLVSIQKIYKYWGISSSFLTLSPLTWTNATTAVQPDDLPSLSFTCRSTSRKAVFRISGTGLPLFCSRQSANVCTKSCEKKRAGWQGNQVNVLYEYTLWKFWPHHSAVAFPACPSKMAKKPCRGTPAKLVTYECASSIVRRHRLFLSSTTPIVNPGATIALKLALEPLVFVFLASTSLFIGVLQ